MSPRRMLVGLVIGAGAGLAAHFLAPGADWAEWIVANVALPVGQIFLRLLFVLVMPLVFSALVVGIAGLELGELGRVGLRTLAWAAGLSTIAALIGLTLVNLVQPGAGGSAETLRALARSNPAPVAAASAARPDVVGLIVNLVPDNPIKAAASGDMIGVIVFALIFGVALRLTRTGPAARLRELMQGLYDVMMTAIDGVLRVAPFGVGALLFVMGVRLGTGFLRPLAAYVAVVLLGLALHLLVVYSVVVKLVGRMSPWRFFRDVRVAMITAFSTASSAATLPTALRVADQLRLPRGISRFVLTVGSTMNQHGTALYEGVTVLFLAQLAGVHLGLAQQALVMMVSVLGGIGAAGVPAGSLPVIAMVLAMLGVPPEGLGLILGLDRLLDMCRTTLNVTGDLVVAVALSRGERDPAPVPATVT